MTSPSERTQKTFTSVTTQANGSVPSQNGKMVNSSGSHAGLCRRVKLFIDAHYGTIQAISEIAEEFKVSSSWLTKIFRTNFDLGPKEYLDHVRIREAMRLLERKKLRCYIVARAVGLKDEDALGKLFRRRGIPSPATLRKASEGSPVDSTTS